MNRADRRKQEKKNKTKLTYEQARKAGIQISKESIKEGIDYATDRQLLIMCLALRDIQGWGHKRTLDLLNKMEEVADSIDKQYLTLEDIRQAIRDELRIDLIRGPKKYGQQQEETDPNQITIEEALQ